MPAPQTNDHDARARPRPRGGAACCVSLAGLALGCALAGPAAAQEDSDFRPYVTAKLGYANSEFLLGAPYNGTVDDGSVAFGMAAGAGFREHLGFEIAMTRYGDFEGRATPCPIGEVCTQVVRETSDNSVRTFTAAIVPHLSLGRLDFFGRVGYYRAKIETDTRFDGNEFTENGLLIGAGARWEFDNRPWVVSVEAARHDDNLYQFMVGVGWQPQILSE